LSNFEKKNILRIMESAAIDSDDAIELRIKLAYSQRRLEESEGLVYKLKESLQQSIEQADAHSARVATLKQVQESLLADKLNAERRVVLLMKEKAELAAENASLRTAAKDNQRASHISALADAALEQSATSLNNNITGSELSSSSTSLLSSSSSSSNINSSAVRSLVVRLLETCHRHGFSLSLNELTAPLNTHHVSALSAGSSSSLSQGQAAAAAGTRAARAELIESLAESLGVLDEVRIKAADGFRSSSPSSFRVITNDSPFNVINNASNTNGNGSVYGNVVSNSIGDVSSTSSTSTAIISNSKSNDIGFLPTKQGINERVDDKIAELNDDVATIRVEEKELKTSSTFVGRIWNILVS
jgi:hypothetical protein